MRASIHLSRFTEHDRTAVLSWPTNLEEARAWAGRSLQRLPDEVQLTAWHSDPDVRPFVLRRDSTSVGYGEIWVNEAENEVELARIIVCPTVRNRGLGRRLVELLLEEAATTGLSQAFVRVVPGNVAALRCYEGAGFRIVDAATQLGFNSEQPVQYVWLCYLLLDQLS